MTEDELSNSPGLIEPHVEELERLGKRFLACQQAIAEVIVKCDVARQHPALCLADHPNSSGWMTQAVRALEEAATLLRSVQS